MSIMTQQIIAESHKWKLVLTHQFVLLRVLTDLGLPLRGDRDVLDDDDNTGVYLKIKKTISNIEPVLGAHLSDTLRIKYLSHRRGTGADAVKDGN